MRAVTSEKIRLKKYILNDLAKIKRYESIAERTKSGDRVVTTSLKVRARNDPIIVSRISATSRERPSQTITCFNCHEHGYLARDCKFGTRSRTCYTCKENGHFARDSPQYRDRNQPEPRNPKLAV